MDRVQRRSTRPKRGPLADVTNAAAPLPLKRLKPKPDPPRSAPSSISAARSGSSIGSSAPEIRADPRLPPSTPRSEEISTGSVATAVNHSKSGHSKLSSHSTKEERKDKAKAVAAPASLSCPPLKRTKRIGSTSSLEEHTIFLRDTYSEPCKRSKKRRHHTEAGDDCKSIDKHMLPQDFIDKQKAYFAEIDAFELPEEVISDSDLE